MDNLNCLQLYLEQLLGPDRYNSYRQALQDWFGYRLTKDFFDEEICLILKNKMELEIHEQLMTQIIFFTSGLPPVPIPDHILLAIENVPSPPTIDPHSQELLRHMTNDVTNGDGNISDINNGLVIYTNISEDGTQEERYIINVVESQDYVHDVEMEEAEEIDTQPPEPVDWLYNAEFVQVEDHNVQKVLSCVTTPRKLNLKHIGNDCLRNNRPPKISYGFFIQERLKKMPHLKPYFKPPSNDNQPYMYSSATIYGRFLLKAWRRRLSGVQPECAHLLIEAVNRHLQLLITEIIKQRRAYRMRDDKICHSVGAHYPNPYLCQTLQEFDVPYTSDSTKMAEVMQVPKILPTRNELERSASLEIASSSLFEKRRFPSTRATLADLLNVIEAKPEIIPQTSLRFKMLNTIAQNYKGFGGNFSTDNNDDNDEDDNYLPICSY